MVSEVDLIAPADVAILAHSAMQFMLHAEAAQARDVRVAVVKVTMAMRVDLGEHVPEMEQMPDVPGLPVPDWSSAPPSVFDLRLCTMMPASSDLSLGHCDSRAAHLTVSTVEASIARHL
jgi:hypothetical protein